MSEEPEAVDPGFDEPDYIPPTKEEHRRMWAIGFAREVVAVSENVIAFAAKVEAYLRDGLANTPADNVTEIKRKR